MKKIAWITADYFIDVDALVVPFLQQSQYEFQIDWFLIKSPNSKIPIPENKAKNVFRLNYRGKDPRTLLQYVNIVNKLKLGNYDIVYSDVVGVPYYFPVLLTMSHGIPIIHAAHNVMPYSRNYKDAWPWALKVGVKYIFNHNKYFQLFSNFTYEYFKKNYPDKSAFCCPMTLKSYGDVRTDMYDVDGNKLNLLFFGKVMGNKRLDLLIQAVKGLPKEIQKKVHLTIAGSCSEIQYYNQLIGDCECISSYFRRIDDDEIPELFTKHQFLMLTYEEVAQSGPHMIAYNYNLPVIASSVEGFTERVIDGENGFIFKVNDIEDLKRVIIKAVNMDEETYLDMKRKLMHYSQENFSLKAVSQKYLSYFNSIVKK